MRAVLCALIMICGIRSAAAEELSLADKVFQGMPCQAWTIIQHDNWSGNNDEQLALEAWTVESMRAYAKGAKAALGNESPIDR
jgi:hypothetical protein